MGEPLCIMVAPNGARRGRGDHPALPITPDELALTARACRSAGAAALHLHVRDAAEKHSLDPATYRAAIAAVSQAAPDMVIQTTTEAAGIFDLSTQISSAQDLTPQALSFAFAELMREGVLQGETFLDWAEAARVAIQFILYDPSQIADFARFWRGSRFAASRPRLILVAGRYSATQDSELGDFEALYAALENEGLHQQAFWMTCAFGRGEMACLERTIELGGHARVGFENAIVDAAGHLVRDNAERVDLVAGLARRHGRRLATQAEAREVLGCLR